MTPDFSKTDIRAAIKSALLGLSVGDALGVPVEFKPRAILDGNPVTGMREYGTYNLPAGTWSDDSSLAFCLADTIAKGFNIDKLALSFCDWRYRNLWTALPDRGVFDIGNTTEQAISRLTKGQLPEYAGSFDEDSNGNGSLMRILPLVFYLNGMEMEERFLLTRKVSGITHGHPRSAIACHYYLEFAAKIWQGKTKEQAYQELQLEIPTFFQTLGIETTEVDHFRRLLQEDIALLPSNEIQSSGYVIHTLEAAIWCLLTTDSYASCVLKAVNLGRDTDTTATVAGGLAGLLYGHHTIPAEWLKVLARRDDIEDLAERMAKKLSQ